MPAPRGWNLNTPCQCPCHEDPLIEHVSPCCFPRRVQPRGRIVDPLPPPTWISTRVAGTSYRQAALLEVHAAEPTFVGLGLPARLALDPENPHDPQACAVHVLDRLIGYVPRGWSEALLAVPVMEAVEGKRTAWATGKAFLDDSGASRISVELRISRERRAT